MKESSPPRTRSEYADVPDMFRKLNTLTAQSAEWKRARSDIVARCMPLAEHIARRFDGRGESREDIA